MTSPWSLSPKLTLEEWQAHAIGTPRVPGPEGRSCIIRIAAYSASFFTSWWLRKSKPKGPSPVLARRSGSREMLNKSSAFRTPDRVAPAKQKISQTETCSRVYRRSSTALLGKLSTDGMGATRSLAGGAKIESNDVSFGQHQAIRRFRLRNYPISGIERDLQIFRAS